MTFSENISLTNKEIVIILSLSLIFEGSSNKKWVSLIVFSFSNGQGYSKISISFLLIGQESTKNPLFFHSS